MPCLRYFPDSLALYDLPAIFPSPFHNTPHPLAKQAAVLLQQSLQESAPCQYDFTVRDGGKMLGVLVVRDEIGRLGFLSGFSGMLAGQWELPGFVPPVFDQVERAAFLPAGEQKLAQLSLELKNIQECDAYCESINELLGLQQQRDEEIAQCKKQFKKNKLQRKKQRGKLAEHEKKEQLKALALESQHDKWKLRNLTDQWTDKLAPLQRKLAAIEQQIKSLKNTRANYSRRLHKKVLATYHLSNRLHKKRSMMDFFDGDFPHAGAGDCAGPKLIHYANQHNLYPIALAEFWWGAPPSAGVRHHAHFYPACRGKCRPILPFMLCGIEVEDEPCFGLNVATDEPQIIYEDDVLLVVNKPAGLMSVPGKEVSDSVRTRLQQRYPDNPDIILVHRLDMSTSGLLLVAKNRRANKHLQKQFIQRTVEKRYVALLEKISPIDKTQGIIDLPLRVDLDDRPRQLVCYEHGKSAQTRWQIVAQEGGYTRVYFYPLTGRSHQLRVHASHSDGLNAPIVGDELYGTEGDRLMLHAQRLCFTHPVSHERMEFEAPVPF